MAEYVHGIFVAVSVCVLISLITHSMYDMVRLDTSRTTDSTKYLKRQFTSSPIDDNASEVFWFMQISDIHISKFLDQNRAGDLFDFCKMLVPIIRPEVVIASGDLTDSRDKILYRSAQNVEEWHAYSKAIRESGVLNTTKWFDIRGNHDTFNVPNWNSSINYFRIHSIQGFNGSLVYKMDIRKPYGHYSLLGFDICLNPGVAFPLNFFGFVTQIMKESLNRLATSTNSSNHVFWFGHYPTSTIVSPYMDIRAFLGETSFAYLSGHLHTAMGFGRHMYALQPQGYWELELGDWRTNRLYRIMAVDHDLVSFVDLQFVSHPDISDNWPIILITNPKNAKFLLPHKEPVDKLIHSTHIRILVWSNSPIVNVSVFVDGMYLGQARQVSQDHPLHVLKWNPEFYCQKPNSPNQMHSILVSAQDANGHQRQVDQYFIVNGSIEFNHASFAGFLLLTNHATNIKIAFYLVWCILFSYVTIPRLLGCFRLYHYLFRSRYCIGIYRLTSSNLAFYSILAYTIYEICGPVFMGFLVDGHFGLVFSFGVVTFDKLLPECLTYIFELIQLLLFQIFILILPIWYGRPQMNTAPDKITPNPQSLISSDNALSNLPNQRLFRFLPYQCNQLPLSLVIFLVLCTFVQFGFTLWSVGLPYGFVAVILSPSRLLPFALIWVLGLSTISPSLTDSSSTSNTRTN